ncbi:MAG TPA: CPBP family intramembrane glutamic endopeptidase [Acidimicrobiales bacterium]|nr:CPBP family intramembrane glutamic endopeptidase [Acidimicrobiales bacterium]
MKPAIVIGGCVLLLLRPALLRTGPPTLVITILFTVLLLAALRVSIDRERQLIDRRWLVVLAVGVAVFASGRVLGGGQAPAMLSARLVALNSLAAVAEEAFFRRVVYAVLAPVGAAYAVVGAASLFALVHVTVYGVWVLPIDLAAGLVFGWQRWATNSWSVPAATHVMANVLVVV